MISEFERQLLCSMLKGKTGITEITKDVMGEHKLRQNYERVKYHLRLLVDAGIIEKNGHAYKIPQWVDVGIATVELTSEEITKKVDAGKTLFVNGLAGNTPAISVIFLEEKQSVKNSS
jgi:predicted transcriptional regulator